MLDKGKWITYIINAFIGELGCWQIDHVFTGLFWNKGLSIEVLRFFTIPVFMTLEDFWILCLFAIHLGIYLPEIYEIGKLVHVKFNKNT